MSSPAEEISNSVREKRYTLKEKANILDFVDRHNAEHGRGGQTSASKKFRVSPLSISSWRKQAMSKGISTHSAAGIQPVGRMISQLQELHERIIEQEQKIRLLRSKFDTLKNSL